MGPSGSGKGTIIQMLKENHPEFVYPLSCTTRPPRPGEIEGEVYHFITEEEFKKKIVEQAFLEYAFIHQQQYSGILRAPVEQALKERKTVIREVDMQGWQQIKQSSLAPKVRSIFLAPPSEEAILTRIKNRSPLTPTEIAHRLESAHREMTISDQTDYQIVTEEGQQQQVYEKIISIIEALSKKV